MRSDRPNLPNNAQFHRGKQPEAPLGSFSLPDPIPEFLPPAAGEAPQTEEAYFDPERWDAEVAQWREEDDRDPVKYDIGKLEGRGRAALLLGDFHLADGTAGGDDFLESHILPDDALDGLYTGFFPPGDSRATLFASVVTFALGRVAERAGAAARLDVVLNGDVINFLELKGRGGTFVSRKHLAFFRTLAALHGRAEVFYLRGNHDYVVPSGPWRRGEYYVNPALRTLAEHGDFWDKENWPPGPRNKGSRLAIELGSAFEVHAAVLREGTLKYLMSGIDNLRPWSNDAIEAFLDRRSKFSDVAALTALLARLEYLGAADDAAAYKGALKRRQGPYRDWLMVQGHTHVPADVPGVYYNNGTWITNLLAPEGKEFHAEAFPFLLVYLDGGGQRVEEYYFVSHGGAAGEGPVASLQTPDSVNRFREECGYQAIAP